jgi:hypothetical protein
MWQGLAGTEGLASVRDSGGGFSGFCCGDAPMGLCMGYAGQRRWDVPGRRPLALEAADKPRKSHFPQAISPTPNTTASAPDDAFGGSAGVHISVAGGQLVV